MNLLRFNIQEVRKVIDNENEANQLLADNWLLLDSVVNDGKVWYVSARPASLLAKTQP